MHASRSDPDFSIFTFQPLPDIRVTSPAWGIYSFLDNLKIGMICGMKEVNGSGNLLEITYYC